MVRVAEVLAMLTVAAFLAVALGGNFPTQTPLREYVVEHGVEETGAVNLVTAIYLGYRAFDTLGETIVLMLAVSGAIVFVGRST